MESNHTAAGGCEKIALNDANVVEVGVDDDDDRRPSSSGSGSRSGGDCLSKVKSWIDPKQSLKDLKSILFWRDMVVESIIVAYVLIVVMFVLTTCNTSHYMPSTTHFGLFAAFTIFSAIDAWGPLCGGLLNPSAVFGFYLCGRMSLARAVISMLFETAGAAAGTMIGFSLYPQANQDALHSLQPAPGLTPAQGMVVEGILTFNLIMVALSVTTPGKHSSLASLAIGCCKGVGLLAGGSFTGGIQNPIIAMGPALATKDFTNHFVVYWIGPFVGAAIAALLYKTIMMVNKKAAAMEQNKSKRHNIATSKYGKLPIVKSCPTNGGIAHAEV